MPCYESHRLTFDNYQASAVINVTVENAGKVAFNELNKRQSEDNYGKSQNGVEQVLNKTGQKTEMEVVVI